MKKKLDVVAGIIIRDDGTRKRIFLIQRRDDQTHPGCWCIPGGKTDGQPDIKALGRELREELVYVVSDGEAENISVDFTDKSPRFTVEVDNVIIRYFLVELIDEHECVTYATNEAQGSGWFPLKALKALDLTPGDERILPQLEELLTTQ